MSNSEHGRGRQRADDEIPRCASSSQLDDGPSENQSGPSDYLPEHLRRPFWVHPAAGYHNAESYFPSTHPFAQRHRMVNRNEVPSFGHRAPYIRSMGAPAYVNAFPRRGIGPRQPTQQMYLPPYMDSMYMIPPPRGIHQERPSFPARPKDLYRMEYDPQRFHPSPHRSMYGMEMDFKAADEAIQKQTSSVSTSQEMKAGTSEGSSESESVEAPVEHPVGTTPIFHPLPSMFHPLPRPLSFPVSSSHKDLPTLALFQNCSLESKVVSDYADSHQELSLMLALPGLSANQAPLLSLQQAGDILQAVNNPLVVIKVGRLTRKLVPNPALLKPSGDVGTLALWLSPTSDVRLFWHSFLKGPTSDSARLVEEQISQIRSQGEGSPYKELFSHVELSEELAWVAAESEQVDGGCGIRLEMMEHDPSGRSFKLIRKKGQDRQKIELASKLATEEEKPGQKVTEENQKLRQLLEQCTSEDPEEEDSYCFWIAESSVSEGLAMLNTMQNRLDHLPTLAGESGVPEKKLQELYDWFSKGQQAASGDSTLSSEIASWIDLRSGASVPSQLFSNDCPANVPNWAESQPQSTSEDPPQSTSEDPPQSTSEDPPQSTSEDPSPPASEEPPPLECRIREGCALSATANFLVADKKWGLTHLATASVMVAVGVESTGFFYDEEKAHIDLSHCAHELAKKRAEAGASAEAERLGRIRLEELVAFKSLRETRSSKPEPPPVAAAPQKSGAQTVHPPSEELIQQQQRQMQSLYERNGHGRPYMPSYSNWGGPYVVPDHSIQGNSVLHHSQVHAHSDVVTHMPDYFRQHVHYRVPADHLSCGHLPWNQYHGQAGGNAQVMVPYQQYEHPSWSNPGTYHPNPWPYGNSAPPPGYQPAFVPPLPPPPPPVPSFFPRHLPPQLPFLQASHLHGGPRHNPPNLSLVRLAQEAREKVARHPRERIRAGPSGSNLTAANIDMHPDQDDVAYAWRQDPASQMGALYRNSSVNVGRMPDSDTVNETRTHAETPKNTTADEADKM